MGKLSGATRLPDTLVRVESRDGSECVSVCMCSRAKLEPVAFSTGPYPELVKEGCEGGLGPRS